VKGTLAIDGVADVDDYAPYNAGNLTVSADSNAAITPSSSDGFGGIITCVADAGTYPVAGYVRNWFVDIDDVKDLCTGVRFQRTAGGTGTESTFVGFSNQLAAAVYAADGDIDVGDGIGLLWNNDLTVDLCAIDGGVVTTLIHEVATSVSNSGFHQFGVRIRKVTPTKFEVAALVDSVIKRTSATLDLAAMRPVFANTISATDAPNADVDWHATVAKP